MQDVMDVTEVNTYEEIDEGDLGNNRDVPTTSRTALPQDEAEEHETDATGETAEILSEPQEKQDEETWQADLIREAEELQETYPSFALDRMMDDATFAGLVTGEIRPTLRQVYEMLCPQALIEASVQARVQETVSAAVESAVNQAVAKAEENLLRHIQTRGMRPRENGSHASTGVRMHPAVHRLTREDRAKLAQMAQRGENVQL